MSVEPEPKNQMKQYEEIADPEDVVFPLEDKREGRDSVAKSQTRTGRTREISAKNRFHRQIDIFINPSIVRAQMLK